MSKGKTISLESNGRTSTKEATNSPSNSRVIEEQVIPEKQLLERRDIPGTPFTAVRNDDKWLLTFREFLLSRPMESYEEIELFLKTNMWDVTASMCISLYQVMEQEAELRKQIANLKENQ